MVFLLFLLHLLFVMHFVFRTRDVEEGVGALLVAVFSLEKRYEDFLYRFEKQKQGIGQKKLVSQIIHF